MRLKPCSVAVLPLTPPKISRYHFKKGFLWGILISRSSLRLKFENNKKEIVCNEKSSVVGFGLASYEIQVVYRIGTSLAFHLGVGVCLLPLTKNA